LKEQELKAQANELKQISKNGKEEVRNATDEPA